MSTEKKPLPPIRRLQCCCCGDPVRGRQWFNRDAGYGVCVRCANKEAARDGEERARELYGVRGVHWGLEGEEEA